MRLILTLFVLLFTQLFFNLAHAAPQARIAAEQRKSHVNEARPDDRKKKRAVKASSKKVKVTHWRVLSDMTLMTLLQINPGVTAAAPA